MAFAIESRKQRGFNCIGLWQLESIKELAGQILRFDSSWGRRGRVTPSSIGEGGLAAIVVFEVVDMNKPKYTHSVVSALREAAVGNFPQTKA
ncbi:hypothetical protein LIER_31051 [Lithospermum erythrorhizon]|uniref:Uncharacterized protein n=1 Tax=Lithospermum erythrorhizon TaxID=34254 RepID=A0AAV3RTA1_LITER